MKKVILLGLVIAILCILIVSGCQPARTPIDVTYAVVVGVPQRGWSSGYSEWWYYTNDEPIVNEATRTVRLTNYYTSSWGNEYGPYDEHIAIAPVDGYIRVHDKGYRIYVVRD